MNYLKESFYVTSVSPREAKAWHAYTQEMLKHNNVVSSIKNRMLDNTNNIIMWDHDSRELCFRVGFQNISNQFKKVSIEIFRDFCQWASDTQMSKYDYLRSIAEKNYPEGTCFTCLDTKIPFYMGDDPTYAYNIREDALRIIGNGGCIYKKGDWAKIIDKNICADDLSDQIPNKLKYISMSDLSTYANMIHRFGNDPKKQARINNLINLEIERRIKNLTE